MYFCITGLPRSRTAWFAAYFTACGVKCSHEAMRECDSIADYEELTKSIDGNSDSSVVLYPTTEKLVIIDRDKDDVIESLIPIFGEQHKDSIVQTIDMMIARMKKLDGLRVKFNDINDRLEEIHHYCIDAKYNDFIGNLYKDMKINTTVLSYDGNQLKMIRELLWRQ